MSDKILTLKKVAEYLKLAQKAACRLTIKGSYPTLKLVALIPSKDGLRNKEEV